MEIKKSLENKFNTSLANLTGSPIREFDAFASTIEGIIKLTLGEPDFDTAEEVKEAAKVALDKNRTHYSVNNGIEPLRISNVVRLGNASKWRGQYIQAYSMYGTAKSPQFAKLKTPGPGEYYLSKALADAVAEYPEDNILARFGSNTKYLGVLPSEYVGGPDALMMVRGASADEVAASDVVAKARGQASYFANVYRTDANGLTSNVGLDPISITVLGVGGTILLFPIVIFVSVATQLGAAQREGALFASHTYSGTMKASVFEEWFEDKLLNCLPKGHVIIMDNAAFHKKEVLYQIAKKYSQRLIFLPPYSPEYNPIEHTWSALKRKVAGCVHLYASISQVASICMQRKG